MMGVRVFKEDTTKENAVVAEEVITAQVYLLSSKIQGSLCRDSAYDTSALCSITLIV
jgi:hypothetical protein